MAVDPKPLVRGDYFYMVIFSGEAHGKGVEYREAMPRSSDLNVVWTTKWLRMWLECQLGVPAEDVDSFVCWLSKEVINEETGHWHMRRIPAIDWQIKLSDKAKGIEDFDYYDHNGNLISYEAYLASMKGTNDVGKNR